MVARMVRDHEAASSSLATPTINQARNAFTAFRAVLHLPPVIGRRPTSVSRRHPSTHRRGGLPRPPGLGERTTWVRPLPYTHQRMSRTHRRGRRPRRPLRRMTDDGGCTRPPTSAPARNGARAVPAGLDAWGNKRRRVRRIKRGYNRPRRTSATTPPRQYRSRGASRTPPLTGCQLNVGIRIVANKRIDAANVRPRPRLP